MSYTIPEVSRFVYDALSDQEGARLAMLALRIVGAWHQR